MPSAHDVPTRSPVKRPNFVYRESDFLRAGSEIFRQTADVRSRLALFMALTIACVALIAFWDARRESSAALAQLAEEQTMVARALAARDAGTFKAIEQQKTLLVFVAKPDHGGLMATDGATIRQATIEDAIARGATWVRLSREESAALGLPARTSVVGIAIGPENRVICVARTAARERDREIRSQWRAVLGVLLTSLLVFFFGGLALRKQRKELELARELAIADLERERDERLRKADKLATLGALATGIAHEVSTPLGVIQGRAEQLLPKLESERDKRAAQTILEQSARINEVIRGFLGLVRGRSPDLVRIDPAQCVEAARELVLHKFTKAGVKLIVDVEVDLPRIACEPRLFEQVLVNLLLNACDACKEGGANTVELHVALSGGRVAFVVLDDGAGITSENAARATEPFFTTKIEGTGLGLAIANEIVKHHNGSFRITPREDSAGTCASVEMPAVSEGRK